METARIAALLAPFLALASTAECCHSEPGQGPGEEPAVLSPAQMRDISTYIDILLRWNAHINLTAIRDPEDIVPRHFGESLFAASLLFPTSSSVSSASSVVKMPYPVSTVSPVVTTVPSARTVADVGSGAGFPGLPLKLWAPHVAVTLIESNHKKATFLREVVRALGLTDVNIVNNRAEALTETFDLVTLRAVENFTSILPTAAALVAPSGQLGILISSSQLPVAQTSLPQFSWATPVPIPLSRSRVLAVATNQQS